MSQAAWNYQSEIALSYYIHIAELIESVSVSRPWLYGLDSFTVMSSHLKSLFHDIEHLLGRFSPFGQGDSNVEKVQKVKPIPIFIRLFFIFAPYNCTIACMPSPTIQFIACLDGSLDSWCSQLKKGFRTQKLPKDDFFFLNLIHLQIKTRMKQVICEALAKSFDTFLRFLDCPEVPSESEAISEQ